jgi:hypothetical protein
MTKHYTPAQMAAQFNARQRDQFTTAYNVIKSNIAKHGEAGLPPFAEFVGMLNDALSKTGTVEHVTPTRDANGLITSVLKETAPASEDSAYQLVGMMAALYAHLAAALATVRFDPAEQAAA